MSRKMDYSLLDQPHILRFVFYPRKDWTSPPPGATDHQIPVEKDVSIGARFYPASKNAPSLLYFHGNGEVVYDHDEIATLYNRIGVNLFVADYRGYGRSTGAPSFAGMVGDSHVIFKYFQDTLKSNCYNGSLFVMGRSLGSLSATELAANYSKELKGLIVESGFASAVRLLTYLGGFMGFPFLEEFEKLTMDRIRSIIIPALIIHGEWDEIIPFEQGEILYQNIGSKEKRLLPIPNAGHNDILFTGMQQYFSAIAEFVSKP